MFNILHTNETKETWLSSLGTTIKTNFSYDQVNIVELRKLEKISIKIRKAAVNWD